MKRRRIEILAALTGCTLMGYLFGIGRKMKKINNQANQWKRQSDKYEQALLMTNRWLKVKQEQKSLEKYFLDKGYCTIAIYGMNYIGIRLYDELKESSIEVLYGIDKNSASAEAGIPIYSPEDSLGRVDAVVVTPVYYYEEIKQDLAGKISVPILSINDVLFGI